jgi:tripartite-type tricarboxylate transporter receptor subunit TctC
MSRLRTLAATLAALSLSLASVVAASAEAYPTRPIKMIVPTPAGGPVDVIARLIGNYLASSLGQAVVIDNRPGAGNTIGSKEAAQAEPDGYTLLYSSASGLVLAPLLQKNAGYDPLASYDPIVLVAQSSTCWSSTRRSQSIRCKSSSPMRRQIRER